MSNGNGHRWSKFWWCDWQDDLALKRCSLAARGLWMAMLCIAHAGEPCGYLRLNGQALTATDLNDMIAKTTVKEVEKLLAELEGKGVFSRTDDGTIYSRRMVKDAAATDAGREHIAKRWGGEAKPPDPPNRGANREASRKPNGEATREVHSLAFREPIPQKLEADSEAEAEERKEEESKTNLLSFPIPAREVADRPSATQLAMANIVGRVSRSLGSSAIHPAGKPPQRSIAEQCDAATNGPALEGDLLPPDFERHRRHPVEPQRTVAEQLAALGFPRTIQAAAE